MVFGREASPFKAGIDALTRKQFLSVGRQPGKRRDRAKEGCLIPDSLARQPGPPAVLSAGVLFFLARSLFSILQERSVPARMPYCLIKPNRAGTLI